MSIQHLLENQREEFEKKFDLNVVCKECDPDLSLTQQAIKSFISTIQQEILHVFREKVKDAKGKTPWFSEDFENRNIQSKSWNIRQESINENIKDLLEQQLSDLSSWLEGDKNN